MQELKPYGNLTLLNKCIDLLDTVGRDMLERIGHSYLDLLDTSSAIYEVDGSYAIASYPLFLRKGISFGEMPMSRRNFITTSLPPPPV